MEGEEEVTDHGDLHTLLFEGYDENCRVNQLQFTRPDELVEAFMGGNSGPDTILDARLKRRQINHMKDELDAVIVNEEGSRTKDDFLELMFTSEHAMWKTLSKQRINRRLKLIGKNYLDEWEYYAFLTCLWSVHYYDKSHLLFDDDQRSNLGLNN